MPIHSGTDKDGSFYQWGSTGKKYHFNPNDKKSRQNALRKAKAQQTAIYSSGWKGDNNMADKMKLIKVKTGDAKPSMRVKAAGNVFVEIYKDNKGFFYKIDVPGQTGYESKERFQDQSKALSSGTAHAKRFIATVKGKVGDAENSKLRDLLEHDVDRFTTAIYNGLGWILKGDIVEQFHRFTNQIWHDPLLDKDQLNKKVVLLVEADAGVEVFNTLTEARKHGYDL